MTDDDKSTDDMNAQEIQNLIEENQRLQRENENLKATRMGVYQREKRLEEAEEEVRCMERRWEKSYECVEILTGELEREKRRYGDAVAKFYEENVVIRKYWGIDEETGKKIYDTDEMRSEFENAMGDFETDEYAECCDCGNELEEDEHTQLDADGRCVCDDCFKGEESGEE